MSNLSSLNAADQPYMDNFIFKSIDYVVFIFMLSISAAIGVYYGFFANGADTTDEYLMGGKRMKTIPIAISLVASQLSAVTIMTIPSEVYTYGINYVFFVITMLINIPILCWVFIPVFYNNNISNCYEYLELRYNRATRELLTMAFMGTLFVTLPIYNFVPSLAFAQVTKINIHVINTVVSSICIFYTMLGGIKAVVWTDVIQASIMVLSVVFIGCMGAAKVGGLSEVFRIAGEGHRLDVDYTFDMESRFTFWNAVISSVFIWVGYVGFNQSCVQRIVSLPTLGHAQRSLFYFGFGYLLIMGFNCLTGIIMYARFHDCDPIKAGIVEKSDKLVPYFVQDVVGNLSGMPGLFISCVFSAALSTLSASINSLTGVIYMDYIKPRIRHTEHRANLIMKSIVLAFGVYCIIGGFLVEKFASILQIMYTISGVTLGAVFGVFTMGMLVPKTHGKAAFWSVVISMIFMLIIVLGAQSMVHYEPLPMSADGCSVHNMTNFLTTANVTSISQPAKGYNLFKLSFNWYCVLGALIVYIFGIPLSYIIPPGKCANFDRNLLSPIVQKISKYQLTETHDLNEVKMKDEGNI